MPTQVMIVQCKCSVAQLQVEVSDCGTLMNNDQNAWLRCAIQTSIPVGSLPGGYVRTEWFGCHTCRRSFKVTTVKGRKTKHACDAKCMASKGPVCECACGGRNHGGAYA